MANKQKQFTIVCIRHTMVFTDEDFDIVRMFVQSAQPDYLHYLEPDIVFAYFIETEKKVASAAKLMDELRTMLASDHRFYGVGISMVSAPMSTNTGLLGTLKAPPTGEAAAEVSRQAYEDAVKNS